VRRDLAFVVDKAVSWQQIRGVLEDLKIPDLVHSDLFDMFENEDRIGQGKKSLAISLIFENPNQTLRDADLERSINLILQALKQKTGASVR
jgi:phenylalanyl-tRNA synthetase beta chain